MRHDPTRVRAALAGIACALFVALPAAAADAGPDEAGQLINDVRQRVAGCGERTRAADALAGPASTPAPARAVLAWNAQLAAAAEQHARAMAEQAFFDHTGRDGRRVAQRADAAGYRWRAIGENLAAGHRTLEQALAGWIRSEGHCRNLLDERFSDFGLARVVSQRPDDRYRVYWALVLGRPAAPVLRASLSD